MATEVSMRAARYPGRAATCAAVDRLEGEAGAADGHEDRVHDRAERVVRRQGEVERRAKEDVDRGRHGPALGVAQDDDQLEAPGEVVGRVPEAAQAAAADAVPGHPDHEEVVGLLLEDRLDRHAGVGAAEHGGEGPLDGSDPGEDAVADVARVERDDASAPGGVEQVRERAVALHQLRLRLSRGARRAPPGRTVGVEAVHDVDRPRGSSVAGQASLRGRAEPESY